MIGTHHKEEEFISHLKVPSDEIHTYTWLDASFSEITTLLRHVCLFPPPPPFFSLLPFCRLINPCNIPAPTFHFVLFSLINKVDIPCAKWQMSMSNFQTREMASSPWAKLGWNQEISLMLPYFYPITVTSCFSFACLLCVLIYV